MKPYAYPVFALFSSMQVSAQPQSKLPNVVILAKRINELAANPDVEVEYYHSILRKHTVQTKFDINQVNSLPKVDILYGYANMNPVLPDAVVNDKTQGVVIAGVGNGNLYPTVEARVKDITRKGVIVVRSSCTGSGRVTLNSETDDAARWEQL